MRNKLFSAKLSILVTFLMSETGTSTLEGLELFLGDRMKVSTQPELSRGLG